MNPSLLRLVEYPFERLARLKAQLVPPADRPHIALSIGEPRHPAPQAVLDTLRTHLAELDSYPATKGLPELRGTASDWLLRRFALPAGSIQADTQVLPVNGTREGLFAFVQAVVDTRQPAPLVLMPNPCYQIYEGAALLAGANPWYLDTTAANDYLPDLESVPASVWDRCQLLFLCSPGNPVGRVMDLAYLSRALELAHRHDFVIASDECYADLFDDPRRPPPSLLNAAVARGDTTFARCMSFHSLSKRSSLPGMRSGIVAGSAELIRSFLLYRTYHGCAMSIPVQRASIAAWSDDEHVEANRAMYRRKFDEVLPILAGQFAVRRPEGGFYVWLDVGGDDVAFTAGLYTAQNVTVVPGSYLGRDSTAGNPGAGYARISLVATAGECVQAAGRIRDFAATEWRTRPR